MKVFIFTVADRPFAVFLVLPTPPQLDSPRFLPSRLSPSQSSVGLDCNVSSIHSGGQEFRQPLFWEKSHWVWFCLTHLVLQHIQRTSKSVILSVKGCPPEINRVFEAKYMYDDGENETGPDCHLCGQEIYDLASIFTYKGTIYNFLFKDDISDSEGYTWRDGMLHRCPGVERPHGCPKCDKRFIRGPSLRKHFRAVHEGLRVKRKCTLCPEVFSSIAMVRKHMQKFHHVVQPTSKRTPCEMCTKTFSNSTGLHRHVELFHFTDRKSCPYGCATRFTSGADWLKHLEECKSPKMITKIGCYCLFCKTTFRNMLLRMEHYLREHPDKSYPCSHCGAQFSRRNALYYHRCDKYGGNQG
ncbi:Zinc finger protein Xfin [Folsomia candida]|uniref:Zinc finger protein Xfin n=1 Tax=Folsomia candida TaxID=158441 RepID=A0A226DW91_FOLCA|nr:Zinc finger protein Xfin [Folsomia candida]